MEDDVARALAAKVASDATALATATAKDARDLAAKTAADMNAVREIVREHAALDEVRLLKIDNRLEKITDNHLFHIEKDMQEMVKSVVSLHGKIDANSMDTASTKSDLKWVKIIGGGAWAVALILFGAMVYIAREAITK